jgi:hypothetical protein
MVPVAWIVEELAPTAPMQSTASTSYHDIVAASTSSHATDGPSAAAPRALDRRRVDSKGADNQAPGIVSVRTRVGGVGSEYMNTFGRKNPLVSTK